MYGRTSDKDLYGATLPPTIDFTDTKAKASEKKERYLLNFKDEDDYDSYNTGDKFNLLLTHDALKPKKEKPFSFIGYKNFKPISLTSDPETYNYLKRLERREKEKISEYPLTLGGFKPLHPVGPNPEETDAYKSIQDILDAHEANKGNEDDEDSKYLTYREENKKKERAKDAQSARKASKPRCLPGRCRKRSTYSYRVRTSRPFIRRIRQRIIY